MYSLGAVLYELLTGGPPFGGGSPTEVLVRVVTEEPTPPRTVCPGVPRDLEAVVLRCLEKDPARRYPTAAELAADLGRYLGGEPVSAARSGLADRVAGALDRVRLRAEFAAYGSLLLALAPVMFLPELWVTVVVWNDWPAPLLPIAQFGRVAGFLACVGYFRGWDLRPRGPAERQLWAIWGGYLVACFAVALSGRMAFGLWSAALETHFYQPLCGLTALAFFALAPSFWGYCAVIGAGFLVLPFVMALHLTLAPLEFGAAWAATLVLFGVRLRRLAAPPPSATPDRPAAATVTEAFPP